MPHFFASCNEIILSYSLCHIFCVGLFSTEYVWETGVSDKVVGLAGWVSGSEWLAGG